MGIGTNLKRLRSKTKYSNQNTADLLGVDRNTYAHWENETTDVILIHTAFGRYF